MNAEIINISNELVKGTVRDSNASFIAKHLDSIGIKVSGISVVGSDMNPISKILNSAVLRSGLVFVTGGLGPFMDDNTKKACCNVFNTKLAIHKETRKKIIEYYEKMDKPIPEIMFNNSFIPKGASIIPNDLGLTPGFSIVRGEKTFIFLPGAPKEMENMFVNYVLPKLSAGPEFVRVTKTVNIVSIGKITVEEKLGSILRSINPKAVLFEDENECKIKITVTNESALVANNLCDAVVSKIKNILGENVYGTEYGGVSEKTVELLKQNVKTVATAESCTAGLISGLITSVPEASKVFGFGISTYSKEMKMAALNVKKSTIENFGTVSGLTAAEMAVGVKAVSGDSIGVSITGVAGPAKSEDKPVGLVYIGLADGERVWVFKRQISIRKYERNIVRRIAASTVMDILRRYLENSKLIIPFGTVSGEALKIVDFDMLMAKSVEDKRGASVDFSGNQSVFTDDELAEAFNQIFGYDE